MVRRGTPDIHVQEPLATDGEGGGSNVTLVAPIPLPTKEQNQLVPEEYDFIDCDYTGSNMTSVIFKIGGAGGVTVATLTITYTGNLINTITRS